MHESQDREQHIADTNKGEERQDHAASGYKEDECRKQQAVEDALDSRAEESLAHDEIGPGFVSSLKCGQASKLGDVFNLVGPVMIRKHSLGVLLESHALCFKGYSEVSKLTINKSEVVST
jgi:hypothetical protein